MVTQNNVSQRYKKLLIQAFQITSIERLTLAF